MVWLLPTRMRPVLCQEALVACEETNMTSRLLVYADPGGDESMVEQYRSMRLPENAVLFIHRMDMADTMRRVFENWSYEHCYGWIADDMRPRTPGWDLILEAEAASWGIATCRDMHLSENPATRDGVLCGAQCFGGDLVRAVGWWALPGVRQAGIDDAWVTLCSELQDIKRYREDVVVEHWNWRTDSRPYDATDARGRSGDDPFLQNDLAILEAWRSDGSKDETKKRVMEARTAAGWPR